MPFHQKLGNLSKLGPRSALNSESWLSSWGLAINFIHNLPLGNWQYQHSTVTDENLKLWPMCQSCKDANSMKTMLTTILKDYNPSRPAQNLLRPGQPIQFNSDKFPCHLDNTLQLQPSHSSKNFKACMATMHSALLLGCSSVHYKALSSIARSDTSLPPLRISHEFPHARRCLRWVPWGLPPSAWPWSMLLMQVPLSSMGRTGCTALPCWWLTPGTLVASEHLGGSIRTMI